MGLKPRRPKFPISVERVKDGRAFKMTESTVRNATICQPGTGRRAAHAAQKAEGLTPEIKEGFVGLACQLSPENLSCDGEASLSDVRRRRESIMQQWRNLENRAGRKVSENEAWGFQERG